MVDSADFDRSANCQPPPRVDGPPTLQSRSQALRKLTDDLQVINEISEDEAAHLKGLVLRANRHTLAVLTAAMAVFAAQRGREESTSPPQSATAEVVETLRVVMQSAFMM